MTCPSPWLWCQAIVEIIREALAACLWMQTTDPSGWDSDSQTYWGSIRNKREQQNLHLYLHPHCLWEVKPPSFIHFTRHFWPWWNPHHQQSTLLPYLQKAPQTCDVHRLALLQQENGSGRPCRWDKPLPSACDWLPELPQPLPTTSSSLHALTSTFALMRDLLGCTINKTHTLISACLKPTDTPNCWLLKQQLTWETNVKGSDLLAEELLLKIRCLSNVMQSTSWNFTFVPTQHLKLLPLEPTT